MHLEAQKHNFILIILDLAHNGRVAYLLKKSAGLKKKKSTLKKYPANCGIFKGNSNSYIAYSQTPSYTKGRNLRSENVNMQIEDQQTKFQTRLNFI